MSYGYGYFQPPPFDIQRTTLAGMTTAQLQVALTNAQAAYGQVMTGGKPVTMSYAQGDGSRSVTYNQASLGQLMQFITLLQRALGLPGMSRRPMRPYFR